MNAVTSLPFMTPAEFRDAKNAIFNATNDPRVYKARHDELNEWARETIIAYARELPASTATNLLKCAVQASSEGPERHAIQMLRMVFALDDPDEVEAVFDDAHQALDAIKLAYWTDY